MRYAGVEDDTARAKAGRSQTTAEQRYGAAPTNKVTYQPNVVIVGGGAASVRSVTSDSLTWVIDGDQTSRAVSWPRPILLIS